jgi:HD-like signal output (HDOD) protein
MTTLRACAHDRPGTRDQAKKPLELVLGKLEAAPVNPRMAADVLAAVRGPDPEPDRLAAVLESAPALRASVLRAVNSPAWGARSEIDDLRQAAVFLGARQLARLAMTASLSRVFGDKSGSVGPYRRASLWRHLVAVALGTRMIALRLGREEPEEAYLAGLVHDVGIILEDQYVHGPFCDMVRGLDGHTLLAEAERRRLGFDHTELGERAAGLWELPPGVRAAAAHHHGSAGYSGPHATLVRCVEAANVLATIRGISSIGGVGVRYAAPAFLALGLGKEDILSLASQLPGELTLGAALFRV